MDALATLHTYIKYHIRIPMKQQSPFYFQKLKGLGNEKIIDKTSISQPYRPDGAKQGDDAGQLRVGIPQPHR